MKILCALPGYNYGSPARGIGTEYEAFLPALRNLGHQVEHFDTWNAKLYPDYSRLNHALLQAVEQHRPDVLLTVQRNYEIWTETLERIHRMGTVALVTWTTDDSFNFPRVSRFIAPFYDAISTTYAYRMQDYLASGFAGAHLTQWAANTHWLAPPLPAHECKYPVTFVGGRFGNREKMVDALAAAGLPVQCFGHGWPGGTVATDEIPRIMRDSVISLNFSGGFLSANGHDRQIKARTFEVPGAGGFLLTESVPLLESVYEVGAEIESFDEPEELVSKVRFYLAHPELRDEIALRGYQRTCREHTYDHRLQSLLDFTTQRFAARAGSVAAPAPLPTPAPSLALRSARGALLTACNSVWGQARGVRAARRIAFEASLRLAGSRTFAASGLPGRMFPFV